MKPILVLLFLLCAYVAAEHPGDIGYLLLPMISGAVLLVDMLARSVDMDGY